MKRASWGGIKALRNIDSQGTWRAVRMGFCSWWYEGKFAGHRYEVRSYAHSLMTDGADDDYVVRWHVSRDGEPIGYPSWSPIDLIERDFARIELLEKK